MAVTSSLRALRRSAAQTTAVMSALIVASLLSSTVQAQAFQYPSLQLPHVSTRDYTAALVGGTGSTALFQWREGWTSTRHVELDAGLADRRGDASLVAFIGGSLGQELARATKDQPLDLLVTGGAGLAFGSGFTVLRVPIGVSLGHTFELDQGMSLTPYVHPRASIDLCSSCGTEKRSRSEVSLNFDLGANFQVSQQFGIRAAGSFTGSDLAGGRDTFAVGLVWTPAALAKP